MRPDRRRFHGDRLWRRQRNRQSAQLINFQQHCISEIKEVWKSEVSKNDSDIVLNVRQKTQTIHIPVRLLQLGRTDYANDGPIEPDSQMTIILADGTRWTILRVNSSVWHCVSSLMPNRST